MIGNEVISAIRKYAVKNAIDYGKASEKSVLGKVLAMIPSARSDMKALTQSIAEVVSEVNAMDRASLEEEYSRHADEFAAFEKKKAEESVPKFVLDGAVEGDFVTRFAPAPNGYMHIGHVKAALLAYTFAQIYKGRVYLYFDDTNPEKDRGEYVKNIKESLEWMGIWFDDEYYASDSITMIYDAGRKLISQGNAYVCECKPDEIKDMRYGGVECAHRGRSREENSKLFELMIRGGYDEGDAIVRFAGDMNSNNTTLRDPTLFRIKKHEHYRQGSKYVVWPTYDINTPIMDSVHGITDILRSKEFELRDELGRRILGALGMKTQRVHSFSRLVIEENLTHKRELNKLISDGVVHGWGDPRLVTMEALRNRGIQPQAIRELVLRFGMSKTDSSVDREMLFAENRRIIDPTSKRLFYVQDPVRVHVEGAQGRKVMLKLHPVNDLGSREYETGGDFYISSDDAEAFRKLGVIRLKELFNIELVRSQDGIEAKETDKKSVNSVQWVTGNNYLKCNVTIPENPVDKEGNFVQDSLKHSSGYVEDYARNLKENEIVQFERFGFCVLKDLRTMQFLFISK